MDERRMKTHKNNEGKQGDKKISHNLAVLQRRGYRRDLI